VGVQCAILRAGAIASAVLPDGASRQRESRTDQDEAGGNDENPFSWRAEHGVTSLYDLRRMIHVAPGAHFCPCLSRRRPACRHSTPSGPQWRKREQKTARTRLYPAKERQ